ncbi:MAG: asparagine synthase (glutamine-hydrolyzing) [Rhodospirillales bacterium]|nr:asparagine synthase (glutamine-hydrolyzing) [Rhodospirillales bacterium]
MCGFAGFLDPTCRYGGDGAIDIVRNMAAAVRHRGPDDNGVWTDDAAGFAVGHQRLSVIDLSAAGHQPMTSDNGRYVIAYNGEIYNSREIRSELEAMGTGFRGHSDTEVILEGCAVWGVNAVLARLNGMFAFALWDREDRRLILARDRLGIKPLYFGTQDSTFFFASELKALSAHPDWRPKVDRRAVAAVLERGYIPAPLSIYQGIFKLRPGYCVSLCAGVEPEVTCYWDLAQVVADGIGRRDTLGEEEALTELEARLRGAVQQRMIADVPLGAFLSGGVDSSLVVSLMQDQAARPVKTFSIGFEVDAYDEAQYAKQVARHLGTDHTELYVTGQHALDVVPRLPTMYDEPFADSSQIPTHLVSALARQDVTVALSGDGGDEVFAGYNHYFIAASLGQKLERIPKSLRKLLSAVARVADRTGLGTVSGGLDGRKTVRRGRDRWQRIEEVLNANGFTEFHRKFHRHWPEPGAVAGLIGTSSEELFALAPPPGDRLDRMQHSDIGVYLPDDILTKVDRASMAVSLEARVPLLDHRVVEWAWQMPSDMKVRGGTRKWALRQILYKHVPREMIERPKQGFAVPVGHWIRGPLRDWAEDLLSERNLKDGGFLESDAVRSRWREHSAGKADWTASLWDALMFEAWRREAGVSDG